MSIETSLSELAVAVKELSVVGKEMHKLMSRMYKLEEALNVSDPVVQVDVIGRAMEEPLPKKIETTAHPYPHPFKPVAKPKKIETTAHPPKPEPKPVAKPEPKPEVKEEPTLFASEPEVKEVNKIEVIRILMADVIKKYGLGRAKDIVFTVGCVKEVAAIPADKQDLVIKECKSIL